MSQQKRLQSLLFNKPPSKTRLNCVVYHARAGRGSCDRELQVTMDKNESTRVTAIISDMGPGSCRSARPKQYLDLLE